jgi:UDP-glucose 6-dehydrogenase
VEIIELGIIGIGFVGNSVYHTFSPYFKMRLYDKFKPGFEDLKTVVNSTKYLFVCVPTPVDNNGKQDLSTIKTAIKEIDEVAEQSKIIILRSTILPGTTRCLSEKFTNHKFLFCPEFLTERTAIYDAINAYRIILGGYSDVAEEVKNGIFRKRYPHTPIFITNYESAELVKYVGNCYFSIKIAYMNEIYEICKKLNLDYQEVRKLFLADQRVANSHTEVPGPDGYKGFGGKCVLPEATLLSDENKIYKIKTLYHKYVRHLTLPKVQSCNYNFTEVNYKEIKTVTRRFVKNEDLLVFETESGKFICSKDHLIPVYRGDSYILIKAAEVLPTDELITSDEKMYCCQCGKEARYILSNKPWCESSTSKCPGMKKRNSDGLKRAMRTEEYHKKRCELVKQICMTDKYRENMRTKINNLYKNSNLKKKVSEGVLRAIKNNPDILRRKSETMKKNKRNCGILNGMKKPEAREKVSKSSIERFKNPEERKKCSISTAKAWVDGKFEGVKTGRCKWYKYQHSNGQTYKVQGTWELSFIKWLDKHNFSFKCHKGRISYFYNGIERSYYPDFWIDNWNCYVDTKCDQFYNEEKMKAIQESNPQLTFKTLLSEDLKKLGVILNEKTKDFKDIEC